MKDPARTDELVAALRQLGEQARFISSQGQSAFSAEAAQAGVLQLATGQMVIRLHAVLNDLSPGFRAAHPDLPYAQIRGMRNRLAHGYSDIDVALLWQTVDRAVPELVEDLLRRLGAS